MEVDIDLIRPSPYQPRQFFDLEDLKLEIQKDGLLSDPVVRKRGDSYELIDGERRWRVLKELGWKTVPVRVIGVDDEKARLSVYKLNKVRENYTVEEEAKYFKKLADEGMTPWEISKKLRVDSRWVQAHVNVFKFPEDIQKGVWSKQISMSHIVALERVIDRNLKEAVFTANEILQRKLTVPETQEIIKKRTQELKAKVNEMRIRAAEKALPAIAPNIPKLETADDFEKTAEVLKKKAMEMREGASTSDEIKKMTTSVWEKESKRKTSDENEEISIQPFRELRKKIETLEKEKKNLLQEKGFLTEALSFNCPHCNQPCIIYREGENYWVE